MLVFWKARLVLLAVPKTGTTALEAALLPHADTAILNPPRQKHCTVRRYRNQLQPFFEQRGERPLELVAVVREPVSWLSSWYRYGNLGVEHLFRHDRMDAAVAFLEERLDAKLDLTRANVSAAQDTELSAAILHRLHTEAPEEFALWEQVCAGAS